MAEVEMTEQELTHKMCHSSAGGHHAALQDVVKMLRSDAGQAFAMGRDDEAHTIRKIANKVEEMRKESSNKLQSYIDKSYK